MSFTVSRLHKHLGKLIEQGFGRVHVSVAKRSFQHNCEDEGTTILPVCVVDLYSVPQSDDDGGTKVNKDGTESLRMTCVLGGECYEARE